MPPIRSARLLLRPLETRDRDAFAAMHADARVGEWLGGTLDRSGADALFDRLAAAGRAFAEDRHAAPAPWAIIDGAGTAGAAAQFLGLAGLSPIRAPVPLAAPPGAAPRVEILWRLAPAAWGRGLALEAATAWTAHFFTDPQAGALYAFTAATNLRSQAVAARNGMQRRPELDFAHPKLPPLHPLAPHVVFCIRRHSWHEEQD